MYEKNQSVCTPKSSPKRKIIIIGATSGIGRQLALKYLSDNHIVGITGRRIEKLKEIKNLYPDNTFFKEMNVQSGQCVNTLKSLIDDMQGMDMIIFCAGIGLHNNSLDYDIEMNVIQTNAVGFSQIIVYSFNYFKNRRGHIVDISSVAGIRPMRRSTAYSATKRFQRHYMDSLAQKAYHDKLPIHFTTVIPGFIQTDFLECDYPFTIDLDKGSTLIYKAIEKKKRNVILPARWKAIVGLWKLIPDPLWERYFAKFI